MDDKTSKTVSGLRFQKYDRGVVHVHDDKKGIKLVMDLKPFKKDLQAVMADLKKGDGIGKVEGNNGVNLYLIKDGKGLTAQVMAQGENLEKEINDFVGTL